MHIKGHRQIGVSAAEKWKRFLISLTTKVIGLIIFVLVFWGAKTVLDYNGIKIISPEVMWGVPAALVVVWMFTGH